MRIDDEIQELEPSGMSNEEEEDKVSDDISRSTGLKVDPEII